ncbi:MFS general substrate transporter [Dissoconium aciculare CBS 342.82]|uniref:MFS general substrate transporter n=1 Tax=Dissoconium aciculare CBS 342.82 TaxID=1314786 RepID=A0A6J3M4A4_9PEZI|nr:MFS general substrate transporter [Dissoconium aciculare CBS 342.82]KAF1822314.1 MFS general substrate transporter [Dissoconium aciculare CBS 342.82]
MQGSSSDARDARQFSLYEDEPRSHGQNDKTGANATEHDHIESLENQLSEEPQSYRVYRSRWFGLAQLGLLNIVISWDWLTFAAVSSTSAQFFGVSESGISWLSTGFLFAFLVAAPATIWVLNRHGPKTSILVASGLTFVGAWIRYAGVRAATPSLGAVVFGQILIGFAQPFVLAAPTRYSNLWFSDSGRVSATALASLANPFGGALGQLIGPFLVTDTSGLPNLVLLTAIISTVAALPAAFIPKAPPTPPSSIAAAPKLDLLQALHQLPKNTAFWLIFVPFSVLVGFFNATSSLLVPILEPYGFDETDSGIAGGVLILVGLVAAAIISPIVDRTKSYLITVKVLVPFVAISYIILIFMPATRSIAGVYITCALVGGTSFSLLPCALELLTLVTYPVSPEVSSTIAWTGGQVLGGIFIIAMTALRSSIESDGQPDGNMTRALIFQAVIACVAVPFVWFLRKAHLRAIPVLP